MLISRCGNLWFFGLLLTISCVQDSLSNPSCAENGAYCQTHHECCSGKCMTYSYICAPVIRPGLVVSRPEYNYLQPNWWAVNNQKPVYEQIEFAILPDDNSNTGNHVVEKVDIPEAANNIPQVDSVDNRTCQPVGNACSDSRDCCSLRCHTYLHRCVT